MQDNHYMKVEEFAKYCHTTRDTLHWYDRLGLVKPAIRGENGYRYYLSSQFTDVDLVRTLKSVGCSLDEINRYFHSPGTTASPDFFMDKLSLIDEQLEDMYKKKNLITAMYNCIREVCSCSVDLPRIVFEDVQYLLETPISAGCDRIDTLSDLDMNGHITKLIGEKNVIPYPHGLTLTSSSIEECAPVFISHFNLVKPEFEGTRRTIKSGIFLQLYQHGDFNHLRKSLTMIRDYMEEHRLTPTGDILVFDLITNLLHGMDEQSTLKLLVPLD